MEFQQRMLVTDNNHKKKDGKIPERPPAPMEACHADGCSKTTHHSVELEWEEAMSKATKENDNKRIRVTLQERDKLKPDYPTTWSNIYSGYNKRHVFDSLEPWSSHTYRMRFQNTAGPSEWSSEVMLTTKKEPMTGEHLHKAVNAQNLDQLRMVLDSGELTSCDTADKYNHTPLMQAAKNGFDEFIGELVNHKADVNFQNDAGKTALMLAAYHGRVQAVKELRHFGADYDMKDRGHSTALHWAMDGKNRELIEWMLDDGANIEVVDCNGWTPLMRVGAVCGDSEVARVLLRNRANVNKVDKDGKTALMMAVVNGHQALVELLLEKGADLTAKNEYGKTAHDMAIAMEKRRIQKILETFMDEHNIKYYR